MKNIDLSFNFSLIKPDGVSKADLIIRKFSEAGLEVRTGNAILPTGSQIRRHFHADDHDYVVKMGKILYNNFAGAGLSKKRIIEVIKFSPAGSFSDDDLYKKAGETLFAINWEYFASGRLIPLVIIGNGDVIAETRRITGATNPVKAEPDTIRRTFSKGDMVQANLKLKPAFNVIHTSGSVEERDYDLATWWPADREMMN